MQRALVRSVSSALLRSICLAGGTPTFVKPTSTYSQRRCYATHSELRDSLTKKFSDESLEAPTHPEEGHATAAVAECNRKVKLCEQTLEMERAICTVVAERFHNVHTITLVVPDLWPELQRARLRDLLDAPQPPAQPLRDAEQRHRDAEHRLRDAEQRLREATQDNHELPTVESILKSPGNCNWLLQNTPLGRARRIGREGFDREILQLIEGQGRGQSFAPVTNQVSVALVLTSASGVGKTYATMCFRSGARRINAPYDAITVYIGLNQGWGLSPGEADALRHPPPAISIQSVVAAVVLQRLCAALENTIANIKKLTDLDIDGLDPQRLVMPAKGASSYRFDMRVPIQATEDFITRQLRTLYDMRRPQTDSLVVMVALDEAQFLDEYATPAGDCGGARYALRTLRQLQVHVFGFGVTLLPIATGIDPKTSLSSDTTGQNITMGSIFPDAVHMSFPHFKELVNEAAPFETIRGRKMSRESSVELLAAVHYPCVRQVLHGTVFYAKEVLFDISFSNALQAVRAGFDKNEFVKPHVLPVCFPVEPRNVGVTPRLRLGLWAGLHFAIQSQRVSRAIALPELPLSAFRTRTFIRIQRCLRMWPSRSSGFLSPSFAIRSNNLSASQ